MTEIELSVKLGILADPLKNRIAPDAWVQAELQFLNHVFQLNRVQKKEIGLLNQEIWAELLPWHSMN